MLSGLFQSTTIPILEQVAHFAQARHNVLAGNIANMDTPGYQVRDLSVEDFQNQLKTAIADSRQPVPISETEAAMTPKTLLAEVAKQPKTLLRHDKNNTSMEFQVTEMAKNQMQHNLALSILRQQLGLMQTAIAGRI